MSTVFQFAERALLDLYPSAGDVLLWAGDDVALILPARPSQPLVTFTKQLGDAVEFEFVEDA